MFNDLRARIAATRTPPPTRRQFFLEAEPVPAPVPGRYEPEKTTAAAAKPK
jgi:hypothetical protein